MKCATIYKRKNKFYLHSMSKTKSGFWILGKPIFEISEEENTKKIGEKVKEALDGSIVGVENPSNNENLFKPVLELAKVKSWYTFIKSSICVEIEKEDEKIYFIPTRNLGSSEGFEPKQEGVLKITDTSFEKIGNGVIEAFKMSE